MIELVVAMAIFAAFFLLVMNTWPLNAWASQKARHMLLATHVAEQEMERTVALGFENAASRSGSYTVEGKTNGNGTSVTLDYTVSITAIASDSSDVVVTVTWQEGGETRNVTCETLLCDR